MHTPTAVQKRKRIEGLQTAWVQEEVTADAHQFGELLDFLHICNEGNSEMCIHTYTCILVHGDACVQLVNLHHHCRQVITRE